MTSFLVGFVFFFVDYVLIKRVAKAVIFSGMRFTSLTAAVFLVAKVPALILIVLWISRQNPVLSHIILLTTGMLLALIVCASWDCQNYYKTLRSSKIG
jgi:hypothetical protein